MIIGYLRRLARTRAFHGARIGDVWLMTTGLLVWRWAARKKRGRG